VQIVEHTSVIMWLLAGVAALAAGYGALVFGRVWRGKWLRPAGNTQADRARFLDTHIDAQWTEGRLRLDSLLAVLRSLERSLERDVQATRQAGSADSPFHREAPGTAEPMLRRFTFDTHLRNECRMLIPLLQFCAKDLMELQGQDMTQKLDVLARIQRAMEAAGPH
jgi:hypothetical protein